MATSPTTVPTVTRMPRMQGFPPILQGSDVARVRRRKPGSPRQSASEHRLNAVLTFEVDLLSHHSRMVRQVPVQSFEIAVVQKVHGPTEGESWIRS